MEATAILLLAIGLGYSIWLISLLFRAGSQRWPFLAAAAATIAWAGVTYWADEVAPLPTSVSSISGTVRLWAWVWLIERIL